MLACHVACAGSGLLAPQRPVIVEEGKNVRLRCAATGHPIPTVVWSKVPGGVIPLGSWQGGCPSTVPPLPTLARNEPSPLLRRPQSTTSAATRSTSPGSPGSTWASTCASPATASHPRPTRRSGSRCTVSWGWASGRQGRVRGGMNRASCRCCSLALHLHPAAGHRRHPGLDGAPRVRGRGLPGARAVLGGPRRPAHRARRQVPRRQHRPRRLQGKHGHRRHVVLPLATRVVRLRLIFHPLSDTRLTSLPWHRPCSRCACDSTSPGWLAPTSGSTSASPRTAWGSSSVTSTCTSATRGWPRRRRCRLESMQLSYNVRTV